MNKILLFTSSVALLIGCQTIDIAEKKFQCSQLDWFEIGRSHGVQGLDSEGYLNRKNRCDGFNEGQHESYVNGWYAGVDEFCSPSHGFAYARSGHKYNNVCPTSKEEAFLEAYHKGSKVYHYESDNRSILEELQSLSEKALRSPSDEGAELNSRISELKNRMEFNRAIITEINREMDENIPTIKTM